MDINKLFRDIATVSEENRFKYSDIQNKRMIRLHITNEKVIKDYQNFLLLVPENECPPTIQRFLEVVYMSPLYYDDNGKLIWL